MALGGGTFTAQNKVLPGTYINFVQTATASSEVSERGIVAIPMNFDYAKDGGVFSVTKKEFYSDSNILFGYPAEHEKMREVRELYRHAVMVYFYRLNGGTKASCKFGTAKNSGIRGNDLKLAISLNVDEQGRYDVVTYFAGMKIDSQTVAEGSELKDNAFIIFNKNEVLEEAPGIDFAGGTNGEVTGMQHQEALNALESYSFNILGCISADDTVKRVYASYAARMRDLMGVKFQVVIPDYAGDYEGIINLKSVISDEKADGTELVYWTAGALAGCEINKSLTNSKYDGEYQVNTGLKQSELEKAISEGEFVFHQVGNEARVLEDINSLVSVTEEKGVDFHMNQVIRVLDQIGNDIAVLFNEKYLGKIRNDQDGRTSLWSAITDYYGELSTIGAIENFDATKDVTVTSGDKKSVIVTANVQPSYAMEKLYMTVYVN